MLAAMTVSEEVKRKEAEREEKEEEALLSYYISVVSHCQQLQMPLKRI